MRIVAPGLIVCFWILGTQLVVGQSLHVLSASGKPGESIAIEISLNSIAEESPTTLKWDTIFPAQLLAIESSPEVGKAGRESGKSITCAQREQYSYACILAGGQKTGSEGFDCGFSL